MRMMERDIEKLFKKWCVSKRYLCLKLGGPAGFPDRTVFLPGGKIVFVELKRPGGTASPIQMMWVGALQNLGFPVAITYSFEEAKLFVVQEAAK